MEGLRALQQRLLGGASSSRGRQAAPGSLGTPGAPAPPAARQPLTARLLAWAGLGRACREPVLPVRTKPKTGSPAGSPAASKRPVQQQRGGSRGALLRAAGVLLLLLAAAACTAGAAAALYLRSIIHEPADALAAAAAEVQAAVAAAAPAVWPEGAPSLQAGPDPLQPVPPLAYEVLRDEPKQDQLLSSPKQAELLTANYTGVWSRAAGRGVGGGGSAAERRLVPNCHRAIPPSLKCSGHHELCGPAAHPASRRQ